MVLDSTGNVHDLLQATIAQNMEARSVEPAFDAASMRFQMRLQAGTSESIVAKSKTEDAAAAAQGDVPAPIAEPRCWDCHSPMTIGVKRRGTKEKVCRDCEELSRSPFAVKPR